MTRRQTGRLAIIFFVLAGMSAVSEYCRTWTNEQKLQNPAGYITHLLRQLQDDTELLRQARSRLQREHQLLCEEQQRVKQRCWQAANAAVELRTKYNTGETRVLAMGQMWTRDQLETQISSLLAEVSSDESLLGQLQTCRESLEAELERMTTQETGATAGLQMLAAQRELALGRRAGGLPIEELATQVTELLANSRDLRQSTAKSIEIALNR